MSRKERRRAAAAARPNPIADPCPSPVAPPPATSGHTEKQQLRETYLARFQPQDAAELALVEEMITAQLRQRSLATIEETAFEQITSAADPAAAFEAQSKCLAAIERARKGYALQFSRALANLTKLRKATKPAAATKIAPPPAGKTAQPAPAPTASSLEPTAPEPSLATLLVDGPGTAVYRESPPL